VADTNVLLSAAFWGGNARSIIQMAAEGRIKILSSDKIVAEFRRVLSYPKFANKLSSSMKTIDSMIEDYRALSEIVSSFDVVTVLRDEDDAIILACAVGGNADYIVTGDQDLLTLDSYSGIPILTPAEFLARRSKDADL
jgi:uncharacterized protein